MINNRFEQGNSNSTQVKTMALKAIEENKTFVLVYLDEKDQRGKALTHFEATPNEGLNIISILSKEEASLWKFLDVYIDNLKFKGKKVYK